MNLFIAGCDVAVRNALLLDARWTTYDELCKEATRIQSTGHPGLQQDPSLGLHGRLAPPPGLISLHPVSTTAAAAAPDHRAAGPLPAGAKAPVAARVRARRPATSQTSQRCRPTLSNSAPTSTSSSATTAMAHTTPNATASPSRPPRASWPLSVSLPYWRLYSSRVADPAASSSHGPQQRAAP